MIQQARRAETVHETQDPGIHPMTVSPEQVSRHLDDLQDALETRGLRVLRHPRAYLTVLNEATGGDTPTDRAMNPGLSQAIALGPDGDALAWFWMWAGPTRDDPPEYERIATVCAIADVVERVDRVLAPASAGI
jgi:hypothetical protein